mgnify:CR=1 FL=1
MESCAVKNLYNLAFKNFNQQAGWPYSKISGKTDQSDKRLSG